MQKAKLRVVLLSISCLVGKYLKLNKIKYRAIAKATMNNHTKKKLDYI